MADRRVTHTRKDRDGEITALGNRNGKWWPRSKAEAIDDIQLGRHTYYVLLQGGVRANILVVNGPTGKFLRTDPDQTERNNLAELPDC